MAALSVATTAQARKKIAPVVVPADLQTILSEVRRPGAAAVLLNVWATWCDPCVEEMPSLMAIYKRNRDLGLRVVLVSADPRTQSKKVSAFLAKHGFDGPSFLKIGDDQDFINGLDKTWSGTMPVSLLFDGQGRRVKTWSGLIDQALVQTEVDALILKAKTP